MRTAQRKVKPVLVRWLLWTIIGFAILITYKSSGAEDSIWPAVFGFTNPLIITCLLFKQGGRLGKISRAEKRCLIVGLISLIMWEFLRHDKSLAQFSLYTAMIADLFAAVPTFMFLWKNPEEDLPFAWSLYAIGYGLAIFAIRENTFANYVLPVYMCIGSSSIASILIAYRIKNSVPLKEWI
jgi:hypothetical protein